MKSNLERNRRAIALLFFLKALLVAILGIYRVKEGEPSPIIIPWMLEQGIALVIKANKDLDNKPPSAE